MKICYELLNQDIDDDVLQAGGTALLSEIEGNCQIYSNGNLFFFEPNMNLLEFAASLYKWRHSPNGLNKYKFHCMDSEHPIFVFSKQEKSIWTIDSIWKKSGIIMITERELLKCIDNFINSLDVLLKSKFGIQSSQFIEYVS
jgi:hypothetical protein